MTGRGLTTQNFVDHSDGQSGGYLECHGMLLGCVKWGLALVYILQESEVAQSCPTLCDPMDSSLHQGPLSTGFSRQEYWSGLPLASRDHPNFLIQGSLSPSSKPAGWA